MALGIGAIIGGITAIAGAFKKSKAASSIPAAPSYPEISPEMQAMQMEMTKYAQVDLRNAFSDMTGGMDVDQYVNTQSAIDLGDTYKFLKESARTEMTKAAQEIIWPKGGFPNTPEGIKAQQQAKDLGAVLWQMGGGMYGPSTGGTNVYDTNPGTIEGMQAAYDAYKRLDAPEAEFSKLKLNIDGKEYKASDFFSTEQFRFDIQSRINDAKISDLQKQKEQLQNQGTAGVQRRGAYPMAPEEIAARVKDFDSQIAGLQQQSTEYKKYVSRLDPIGNYYNAPETAKSLGMSTQELKRTLADVGLYDETKQQYYQDIPQAVAANGGKLPTDNYNTLLMARVAMEAKGDYTSAENLDGFIKDSNPKFYDKYFNETDGIWTAQNPLEKYKDPKLEKPDYVKHLEEAIGGSIDKLFQAPASADSALGKSAAAQFGKAGQLLDQAVTAGAKTDDAANKWLQDALAKGTVTPIEFDQAQKLLMQVPGVLSKIDAEKAAGQKSIGGLNDVVTGALSKDWNVQAPADQRREGVLNSLTTSATTGQPAVTPGSDPYREAALGDLLNRARSTTNPYQGMTEDEMAAQRQAGVSKLNDELQAGLAQGEEILAQRNVTNSTEADRTRMSLLNEIMGKRGGELEAQIRSEQLARSAEAANMNAAEKTSILNSLAASGQQNVETGLQAQQFNAQQRQALMDQILSATDANTQAALKSGQINLDALVQKVGAANQSAQQQSQTLASMLGITAEQANAMLKSASAVADVGAARANANVQGTTAMTNVANTAADAANQARNTGLNAAKTATDIGAAAANTNESFGKTDANTTIAQTGLLNGLTNLAGQDYEQQTFNQLQPMEMEIAKKNAMTGAISDAGGILNNYMNTLNNKYQADLNSWSANAAKTTASANAKADAFSTVGSVLGSWFK
jgi:hypothetical protein